VGGTNERATIERDDRGVVDRLKKRAEGCQRRRGTHNLPVVAPRWGGGRSSQRSKPHPMPTNGLPILSGVLWKKEKPRRKIEQGTYEERIMVKLVSTTKSTVRMGKGLWIGGGLGI